MDKNANISQLITGQLLGQLTTDEQQELDAWLNADESHRKLYDSIAKNIGKELSRLQDIDTKSAYKSMKKRINSKRNASLRYLRWLSAAAVITLVAGFACVWLVKEKAPAPVASVQPTQITHGSTKAFVYLDNGKRIDLGSDINSDMQALSSISHGDYDGMITMRTPRGGEFAMTLPDSTQVWLNAESSITYPASFDKELRKVAISGEAYFKVKHNPQWPFEVDAKGETARVLGTEFNINAYDADHIITTLFEGSLAVSATGSGKGFILSPGQTADFFSTTKSFTNADADTAAIRGWLHGRFVFENQPLGHIMKELSRWYNFDYTFADRSLASTVFMGSVPRYGDFREVLKILEMSGGIEFKQKGRKITIEKRK